MEMQDESIQKMLLDFQQDFSKVAVPEDAVSFSIPAPEVLNLGNEQAMPLIKLCPPQVKATDFFSALRQVAGIARKFKPDLEEEIAQVEAALPVEPAQQEHFVSQAFTPGTNLLADLGKGIPSETFGFLLNYAVKPFILQYAQKVNSLYDPEQWLKGNCPVCGGAPTLALLEKEFSRRYLYCGLCEVKWRFQRLGCPYCYNNESQYFTIEGMDMYRIYFCEKCRGYVKTIDEEKAGGNILNLLLEDINTIQLDIMAMREGYYKQRIDQLSKGPEK